ncbi:MAG: hypothetical protein MJ209_05505 [archaeon]|nr:hypothetical protein [archaeon]
MGARKSIPHKNPSNKMPVRSEECDTSNCYKQLQYSKKHMSLKDFYNDPRNEGFYGKKTVENLDNSVSSDSIQYSDLPLRTYGDDVQDIVQSTGIRTKLNPNGLETIPEMGVLFLIIKFLLTIFL